MTYKGFVYSLFINSPTYTIIVTRLVICTLHSFVSIHGVFIHVNNKQINLYVDQKNFLTGKVTFFLPGKS